MINNHKVERIRFIKLGSQNSKLKRDGEERSLEKICLNEGKIVLGFREVDHSNNDEEIINYYLQIGEPQQTATSYLNQIKKFYNKFEDNEKPETTLWITFADKKLWWGFMANQSETKEDGWTFKTIEGGWKNQNVNGELLTFENISGALLKTQGYRGTICDIKESDEFPIKTYTERLILGKKLDEVIEAESNRNNIQKSMESLLKLLHPQDSEYIVDLIFQYSGWKKLTPGAGVEKDIDLDLLMPLISERAFVQIKSTTNQNEYNKYEDIFYKHDIYDRLFYVYHSSEDSEIEVRNKTKPIHIMKIKHLAKLIVELGLINILIKKVS